MVKKWQSQEDENSGRMTPNLELLTTSSVASLFHLSGKLSFTIFSPTSCPAFL